MAITDLSQLDLNGTYTYADYLTWQVTERIELLKGKIALMSPAPNLYHQRIVTRLSAFITTYLMGHHCQSFVAPFDVRLPKPGSPPEDQVYTVVQPDICMVCDEAKLDVQGCIGAPDLVVEVLSPGNTRREMRDKYSLYEEAGVKEYWLVDPAHPSLTRYVLNEQGIFIGLQPLTETETLETDLLPNWSLALKDVFGWRK